VLVCVASPAGASPYRLPYPDGHAYTITQAPGGWITTHVTAENRHAVDFAMPEGTPVVAARAGRVVETEWRHGSGAEDFPFADHGNTVLVAHDDGTRARYSHLRHNGVAVAKGAKVVAGEVIGYSGTTGYSSGPHLHFGLVEVKSGVEVSLPVLFYVGRPPVRFAPRAGLSVRAEYSSPAEAPRSTLEQPRLAAPKRRVLAPGEEPWAWLQLAAWLASAATGMAWFWNFSRRRGGDG
jgi:murein DD-endopeptidase MepM/ murein hydrolase activator NlpD